MKKALYAVLATALSLSAMAPAMANDQPCDPCGPSASPTGAGDVADLARQVADTRYNVNLMLERGDPLTIPIDVSEAAIILSAACPNGCVTTTEMEDAKKRLTAMEKALSSFHGKLTSQGKRLDGLELAIAQTNSALYDLGERVTHTEARITGLEARAGAQAQRTTDLEIGQREILVRVERVEGLVDDLSHLRLAGLLQASVGVGRANMGLSVPIMGAGGAEMQMQGENGRILSLRALALFQYDPMRNDSGGGAYLGAGGVLNPGGKQDMILLGGLETLRLSTRNYSGFSDAIRWEWRPSVELRIGGDTRRSRGEFGIGAGMTFSHGTAIAWEEVGGVIAEKYVSVSSLGGFVRLSGTFAIGPRWGNWRK